MATPHYDIDLSTPGKTACPKCQEAGGDTHGDNLHVYGPEQGAHCHACGFTIRSDERKAELAEADPKKRKPSSRETPSKGVKLAPPKMDKIASKAERDWVRANTSQDGKGWRGISSEVNEFYKARYEISPETGEPVSHLIPTTVDGKLVGWKRRVFPKDFSQPVGKVDIECDLMGQFLFPTHTRVCLITGGESKMQSSYQMILEYYRSKGKGDYELPAVVCPTTGETSAHKQIRRQYKWLSRFDKIIVCMDNDDAGDAATQALAQALPKGKVWVMAMRYKDADEYVEARQQQQFIADFFGARKWMPSGIVGSSALSSAIRQSISTPGIPIPDWMPKLKKSCAGRIPLRSIVNIGSASGTGKTTVVDELTYFWIFNTIYKPGILSLENDQGQYGVNLLSRHLEYKINLIEGEEERLEFVNRPENVEKEHILFNKNGEDRFFLMDERGGSVDDVKAKIEEMVISLGVQLIIIDPLQDLMAGLSIEEQEEFMKWQKTLVRAYPIVIININHVRKNGGGKKANSVGADLYEEDMAGSSTVFKSGTHNWLFTRDKEAEDIVDRNTTVFKATKNRCTGITGIMDSLLYVNALHRLFNRDWYFSPEGPGAVVDF